MNLVKDVETESFKNWSVNFIANRHFKICFLAHECESPDDSLANKVLSPGNPEFGLMSKVGPVEMLETGLPELVIYIPWYLVLYNLWFIVGCCQPCAQELSSRV